MCPGMRSSSPRTLELIFSPENQTLKPPAGDIRVVSCDRVHQHDFVLLVVKRSLFRPSIPIHLVNKRTLSDDSADEVHGERMVIRIRAQEALGPIDRLVSYNADEGIG